MADKIIARVLSWALRLSPLQPLGRRPCCQQRQYSDVASHTEAGPAINSTSAQGITRGASPTQFAPEASLT